jgi:hypothetical protein
VCRYTLESNIVQNLSDCFISQIMCSFNNYCFHVWSIIGTMWCMKQHIRSKCEYLPHACLLTKQTRSLEFSVQFSVKSLVQRRGIRLQACRIRQFIAFIVRTVLKVRSLQVAPQRLNLNILYSTFLLQSEPQMLKLNSHEFACFLLTNFCYEAFFT